MKTCDIKTIQKWLVYIRIVLDNLKFLQLFSLINEYFNILVLGLLKKELFLFFKVKKYSFQRYPDHEFKTTKF